jgi:hypothetical protein
MNMWNMLLLSSCAKKILIATNNLLATKLVREYSTVLEMQNRILKNLFSEKQFSIPKCRPGAAVVFFSIPWLKDPI